MAHMSCTPMVQTYTCTPNVLHMAHSNCANGPQNVQDSTGMVLYLLIESFAQFDFPDY